MTGIMSHRRGCIWVKRGGAPGPPAGTLFGWGYNANGQLGLGVGTILSPTQASTDTDWMTLSGNYHAVHSLKSNNTLWGWGGTAATDLNGSAGLIGDGAAVDRWAPVQVGSSSWLMAGGGEAHGMGIKSNGTLWGWGNNTYGELGQGSVDSSDHLSPIQIGSATWKWCHGGRYYSLGVQADGTLWGWGYNSNGQLGDGTTTDRTSPVQIGSDTDWAFVSASYYYHSFGIKDDGSLYAWGHNPSGQLGDGTTTQRTTPTRIGSSTWTKVLGGYNHSIGIQTDGTLWGWGDNSYGQLGDGTTTTRHSPTSIGSDTWVDASADSYVTAGIKADGTLYTWGTNYAGALGQGTEDGSAHPSPTQVGSNATWVRVLAFSNQSCMAIRTG